jgi:hypothetical protein
MRYYKSLIVNAEHEVLIATNYWEPSWASHLYVSGLLLSILPSSPLI